MIPAGSVQTLCDPIIKEKALNHKIQVMSAPAFHTFCTLILTCLFLNNEITISETPQIVSLEI